MSEILKIENLSKNFGKNEVLKGVNFTLAQGEILSVLGESGCGKSTLLRIIAGLEAASSGKFELGSDVGVAMMFQSYALFPHLNVYKNVEFALSKLPASQRKERVNEMLAKFKIAELAQKMCDQISGGQAQRVAFARAVANREKLLLLDEPFANLDHNLRSGLRTELKEMIRQNGLSAIMVTHDKEDAFLLSDRIALIKNGVILAIDTPQNLYLHPNSYETAKFLGDMNLISEQDATRLPSEFRRWLEARNFMFRPHEVKFGERYEAVVLKAQFLGAFYELDLEFCRVKFKAVVSSNFVPSERFKFDLA